MSLQILEDCIKKIKLNSLVFRSYVLKQNKIRNTDEINYTSFELIFNKDELKELSLNMLNNFINKIKKDKYDFQEYNGFNTKVSIDKIFLSNILISSQWEKIKDSIKNPMNNFQNKEPSSTKGFFIEIQIKDEKPIYLITKQSPLNTYKKVNHLFKLDDYKVYRNEDRLIKFPGLIDTIIYDNTLYNINNNFESIFNIESSLKSYSNNCIDDILSKGLINDEIADKIRRLRINKKKIFIKYSSTNIEKIYEKEQLNYIEKELNIKYDNTNKNFILETDEKINIFLRLICGEINKDFNDNKPIHTPNSLPLS